MTTLIDWQFDLDGVPFGVGQPVAVSKFDRTGPDTRNQDQPAGWGDWMNFGRDYKTPGVWSWELVTMQSDATSALAALEVLEAAWDADAVRRSPGAVVPLRYTVAGRTRRVFGRPRRFTAPLTTLLASGRIDIVADFQLAESVFYDDLENVLPLAVGEADLSGSGINFPVAFPTLWGGTVGTPGTRNIIVGGNRATWLTATITGPITDPYVIVAGAVFQTRGVLASGETTIISALPWAAGLFRPDGTTSPLSLDAQARLADLAVGPGSHEVTFGGIDNTGTARCVVSWRDAHGSI